MSVYKRLMTAAVNAKVTKQQLAILFGVSVAAIDGWWEQGVPDVYEEEARNITQSLDDMVKKRLLPKSQAMLSVLGLVCLSKGDADAEGDRA